jgi:hypothetical protein
LSADVQFVIDPGVVCVVVGGEDAMLDQWSDSEIAQSSGERILVVRSVCNQFSQVACVPSGDLLTKVDITSFTGLQCTSRKAWQSVSTSFVTLYFCTR